MTWSRDPIPFSANEVDRTNTQQLLQRESEDGTLPIAPAPFLPSRSWSPVIDCFPSNPKTASMRIIREALGFNSNFKEVCRSLPPERFKTRNLQH